jgi:hypothetical protein
MKYYLILTILFLCVVAVACNSTGTPVEFSKACSFENDKKYIEVNGFLDGKGAVYCSNTGGGPVRCGFKLLNDPKDEKGFTADIERGTSANNVEDLKSGYKLEDIKIHDNNGNVINLADKFKITGKLNTMPDASVCYLTVTKIEK